MTPTSSMFRSVQSILVSQSFSAAKFTVLLLFLVMWLLCLLRVCNACVHFNRQSQKRKCEPHVNKNSSRRWHFSCQFALSHRATKIHWIGGIWYEILYVFVLNINIPCRIHLDLLLWYIVWKKKFYKIDLTVPKRWLTIIAIWGVISTKTLAGNQAHVKYNNSYQHIERLLNCLVFISRILQEFVSISISPTFERMTKMRNWMWTRQFEICEDQMKVWNIDECLWVFVKAQRVYAEMTTDPSYN